MNYFDNNSTLILFTLKKKLSIFVMQLKCESIINYEKVVQLYIKNNNLMNNVIYEDRKSVV